MSCIHNRSISIVFINSIGDEKKDDRVTITRDDGYNGYNVRYLERSGYAKAKATTLYSLGRKQVEDYVYSVLKNLAIDEQPCESVQVNVPVMPRVLFSVDRLKDDSTRRHVTDMVCDNLEYLDYLENPDEYDEMPPLVPISYEQPRSYVAPPTPPTRATAPGVLPQRLFWDE